MEVANSERQRKPPPPMPMKFHKGCMIFGNAALGHSSIKFKPRRRSHGSGSAEVMSEPAGGAQQDDEQGEESTHRPLGSESPFSETTKRTIDDERLELEVVRRSELLLDVFLQCDPPAPASVPLQGRIVQIDAISCFVKRHQQLSELRGLDAALPRIVYHWTQEKNFKSIAETGLRVPDGAGVEVAHGSSFGVGIYVSPDFRYGREMFAYGAPAAVMCLALPGRQHFGKLPPNGAGLYSADGFDSVVGREGQRGVDEWVFFRTDQLLPCFLVDQLGLIPAKEALQTAIKKLHCRWPQSSAAAARAEEQLPAAKEANVEEGDCGEVHNSLQDVDQAPAFTGAGRWGRRQRIERCQLKCELNQTVCHQASRQANLEAEFQLQEDSRAEDVDKPHAGRRWVRPLRST